MSVKADKSRIRNIDLEKRTIEFDPRIHGKVTGSRFFAVLGNDPYTSEFEAACNIARIYSVYEPTKYTQAGEIIEPVLRSFVRENATKFLSDQLDLSDNDKIGVEEPVNKFDCGFDHFPRDKVFGGMVDGYVRVNGKRAAILEIKTAGDRGKWKDENGNITKVPENYILQASLYAELSGLKKIVFAVGFLEECDYESPKAWKPTENNTFLIIVDKKDMSADMDKATKWFNEHIIGGITPEWSERDEKIISYLTTKKVDFVSNDLTKIIKDFIDNHSDPSMDSEKDAKLKDIIKLSLSKLMSDRDSKLEYEQSGFIFILSYDVCGEPILKINYNRT